MQLPQSSDGLQLTRVDQDKDSQAQTDEEAREQIQDRLPGADWKARIGAAGTPMEQQRVSPIVELSMLLVRLIPSMPRRNPQGILPRPKWRHATKLSQ